MHRKYEPSRLSQVILEQAYTKIIPGYIKVLDVPASDVEELCEMCQQPQEGLTR